MADIKKLVSIDLFLNSNIKKSLESVIAQIDEISAVSNKAQENIDKISNVINKFKVPDGLSEFISNIKELSNIDSKKIENLSTSLDDISKLEFNSINKINSEKIQIISEINYQNIQGLANALKALNDSDIDKLSNIDSNSLKKLSKISTDKILDLAHALELISTISEFKNIDDFVDSIIKLGGVKSSNFLKIKKGLDELSKIKLPDFSDTNNKITQHADAIKKLADAYATLRIRINRINLKESKNNLNDLSQSTRTQTRLTNRSRISFSQWGYAIGSASTGLSRLGTKLYGVTRGFSAVSKKLGAALIGFTSFFTSMFVLKDIVEDLQSFDDAILKAASVAKASSVQLQEFAEAARLMGETTRYTAQQSADALGFLAMAGLDATQSIQALPTVLNAAAAAGIKISDAADILTNVMTGYKLEVSDLPRVTDILTASFTNSNTTLIALNESFKQTGPIMKAAGVPIEETSALISSLANAGYRGGKAGTILKNAIGRLLAPTRGVVNALAKYNIEAQALIESNTDSKTGILSFIGVLNDLRNAGLTTGDQLRVFGKIAGPGVTSLLNQSEESIGKLNDIMIKSQGTALKVAYEMESGLGGTLRRLNSFWSELGIAIGEAIKKDIITFISDLTNKLKNNKDTIVNFTTSVLKLTGIIIKFGVSIADLIVSFPKVTLMLGALTASFLLFNAAVKIGTITGVTKAFVGLSAVNFAIIGDKIFTLALGIESFGVAAKAMLTTGLASGFAQFTTGIQLLGVAIGGMIANISSGIYTFVTLHPWIIAIGVAITGVTIAVKLLNKDYDKLANSSHNLALKSNEILEEFKYQSSELKLIKAGFESAYSSTDDFANLQQRLKDLLYDANIPFSKRIELLNKLEKDQKNATEVMKELNIELEKGSNKERVKQIQYEIAALSNRKKEIVSITKKIENLNKVRSELSKNETTSSALKIDVEEISKLIIDQKLKLQESTQQYQKYFNSIKQMAAVLASSGVDVKTFNEILSKTSLDSTEIEKIKSLYSNFINKIKNGEEVVRNEFLKTKEGIGALINSMAELNNAYNDLNDERAKNNKLTIQQIETQEANGIISAKKADKLKLQSNIETNKKIFEDAKETFEAIKEIQKQAQEAGSKDDLSTTDEFIKAQEEKAKAYFNYVDAVNKGNQKLTDEANKYKDEVEKTSNKISEIESKLKDKRISIKDKLTTTLTNLEKKYADNVKSIQEKLNEKLSDLAEKRKEIELNSKAKIEDLNLSLHDKLRKISQERMSDDAKEFDNKKWAYEKIKQAQEKINQARITGDEAGLKSGVKLIEQSQSLFEGLKDREAATQGIINSYKLLSDAEKTSTRIKLDNIAKEKKEAENAANEEINKKKNILETEIKNAEDASKKKIRIAEETANKIIEQKEKEIKSQNKKISLIEKEILTQIKLKALIESKSGDTTKAINEKAVKQYNELIKSSQNYLDKLDEIDKKEVSPEINTEKLNKSKIPIDETSKSIDQVETKINNITEKIKNIEIDTKISVLVDDKNVKILSGDLLDVEKQIKELRKNSKVEILTVFSSNNFDEVSNKIKNIKNEKTIVLKINEKDINIITGTIQQVERELLELENKYGSTKIKIISEYDNKNIDSIKNEINNSIKDINTTIPIDAEINEFEKSIDKINTEFDNIDSQNVTESIKPIKDSLIDIESQINNINNKNIDITLKDEIINNLIYKLEELKNKIINIEAKTKGEQDLIRIKNIIDNIKDKTVKINIQKTETEAKANGGYISPQKYADGGSVFKRLVSRYITKGSGNKDDVPALLMKKEFVHKASAVKKYGVDFMNKLNLGLIPKTITQAFANGGFVSKLSLPFGQNNGINNITTDLFNKFNNYSIPKFANGGYVNTQNNTSQSQLATINLNLNDNIYPMQTPTNIARDFIDEITKQQRRALLVGTN